MKKIISVKNNKWAFCKNAHIFEVLDGDVRAGVLVRIEAVSHRRNPNHGDNRWDIFYFRGESPEVEREIVAVEGRKPSIGDRRGVIALYGGECLRLMRAEEISTPFGVEYYYRELRIVPVQFCEAQLYHLAAAKEAAIEALDEGFGQHGEIVNHQSLRDWCVEGIGA
jgi:hypothetical protein